MANWQTAQAPKTTPVQKTAVFCQSLASLVGTERENLVKMANFEVAAVCLPPADDLVRCLALAVFREHTKELFDGADQS
jgi:hypothetical protein